MQIQGPLGVLLGSPEHIAYPSHARCVEMGRQVTYNKGKWQQRKMTKVWNAAQVLKPVWLMTCGCATCVLPTQRAGGTKESSEAQVGLEWGADTPERTVTSKGMATGLCRVWSVTLMAVPRNPNPEGNWVRSSLCLGDRSFSPCKVKDLTDHPGQSMGCPHFTAAELVRIPERTQQDLQYILQTQVSEHSPRVTTPKPLFHRAGDQAM